MLGVAVTFVFGFALQEQRLDDKTPVYAIDHAMDARLDAYVPLMRAGEAQDGGRGDLVPLARAWGEAYERGRLLSPMPARYGDLDGPRAQIVQEALRIQSGLAMIARCERDPVRARRLLTLAMEPLRSVRYADVGTLAKIEGRRKWLAGEFVATGLTPTDATRATAVLVPEREKLAELLRHMARLRNQFRVRFERDEDAWIADPYFESLAQGGAIGRRIARR